MTILPIVKNDITALTKQSQDFDFDNPPMDPIQLAQDLVETMYDAKGIGLAGIQVGIPYRVFAMRGLPHDFVYFNPIIVDTSPIMVKLEEGCLSFPGLFVEIKRPRDIRFRATFPNGETDTYVYSGLTARVIQHEMQHLDGGLFYNLTNKYKRNKAFKEQAKYLKRVNKQDNRVSL